MDKYGILRNRDKPAREFLLFASHTMTDYVEWFDNHCQVLNKEEAKLIKALKKCEVSLAQNTEGANKLKVDAELALTQSCIGAFISKTSPNEKVMSIIDADSQLKPNRVSTQHLYHLSKSKEHSSVIHNKVCPKHTISDTVFLERKKPAFCPRITYLI